MKVVMAQFKALMPEEKHKIPVTITSLWVKIQTHKLANTIRLQC